MEDVSARQRRLFQGVVVRDVFKRCLCQPGRGEVTQHNDPDPHQREDTVITLSQRPGEKNLRYIGDGRSETADGQHLQRGKGGIPRVCVGALQTCVQAGKPAGETVLYVTGLRGNGHAGYSAGLG